MAFLKKTKTATTSQQTISTQDVQKRIEERAYDLYQKRGFNNGNDLDDWFQAEREITGEILKQTKKTNFN